MYKLINTGIQRVVTNDFSPFGRIQFYGSVYTLYDSDDKMIPTNYAIVNHDMRDQYIFFEQDPIDHLYKGTSVIPKVLLQSLERYGLIDVIWDNER